MYKVNIITVSDSEAFKARSMTMHYNELSTAQKALESLSASFYVNETHVTIYRKCDRQLNKKLYAFELNARNVNLLKLECECKLAQDRVREIESKREAYASVNDLSAYTKLLKSAIRRSKDAVFSAYDFNVQSIRA